MVTSDIDFLKERLPDKFKMSEQPAKIAFEEKIESSINDWYRNVDWWFHVVQHT